MEDIQNKAISLYNKNLQYLMYNETYLYQRIEALSHLINQNEYRERYILKYIADDKNFDIYDTVEKRHIYDKKPSLFIDDAINNTSLDKKSSIDLLHPNTYNIKQPSVVHEYYPLSVREQLISTNDIFDYIKLFRKSTVYKKKQFKYIEKFIFVGTLLGSHILPVHEKLKSTLYFIYEYNLEIFRLSLFVTDYMQLSKESNLIFSIMDEKLLLEHKLAQYFNYAVRSNYMVKYFCTNYNINDFFDRVITVSSHRSPLAYNYSKMIEGLIRPLFKNQKEYPVLNTLKQHTFLQNRQVLMIAAGPSLEKNIDWVVKNKDNFFIITIGAAITKLLKHKITPDIIVSVDADEVILNQFPEDIMEQIKHIPFIASIITQKNVLNLFDKKSVFLFEVIGCFKDISSTVHGYSVGEMTLNICSVLGAEHIYLLGTDLALDPETGTTHVSDHKGAKKFDISEANQKHNSFMESESYNLSNSTVLTKGNLRDSVLTTIIFEKSITSYIRTIKLLKNKNTNISIYNLCDGAFIEGSIPLNIKDIVNKGITTKLDKESIVEFLAKNSELGFSKNEKESINQSISTVKKLVQELDKFSNLETDSYDTFLNQQSEIVSFIYKQVRDKFKRYSIDRVFINYILTMEPYLGYQFNEKDIDESKFIKDIKETWIGHMKRLSNQYISIASDGLKK